MLYRLSCSATRSLTVMPSSTLGAAPCSPSRSGGGGCSPPSPSHRSPDRASCADALFRPGLEDEAVRLSRGVALAVELFDQAAYLPRVARSDEHALLRRDAVHRAPVRIKPKLVEVLRLRALCLRLIDGHSIGLTHQQVDLPLQPDRAVGALLAADAERIALRRLLLRELADEAALQRLARGLRLPDIGADPTEERLRARVSLDKGVLRRLRCWERDAVLTAQVDLREEAVAARVQRPSEHLAVQAALNAAAVDADLKAGGGHVALIVGGFSLSASMVP